MALLLSLCSLLSCSILQTPDMERDLAQIGERSPLCHNLPIVPAANFDWPHLKSTILENSVDSVDQALCLIPQESRSSVGLMVSSVSLQRSSVDSPRVILSSPFSAGTQSERLFFSFNGPHYPGGDEIEVMRFRPKQPPDKILEMIEAKFDGRATITEGTPARCQKCHGIEPQFLWSQRDFWPAAAGGGSIYRTEAELLRMNQAMAENPRYSFLNGNGQFMVGGDLSTINFYAAEVNSHRLVGKIKDSPNYHDYKFAILGGAFGCYQIESFLPKSLIRHHQNVSFVQEKDWEKVSELYSMAVTQLAMSVTAKNSSMIPPFYTLLDSILGATPVANELPGWQQQLSLPRVRASTFHSSQAFALYTADMIRIEKNKLLFGMIPEDNIPVEVVVDSTSANLRYLFEGRGIGISDWSYDDIQGTYHFGLENMALYPFSLAALLVAADPELRLEAINSFYKFSHEERVNSLHFPGATKKQLVCESLKENSLKRLAPLAHPQTFRLAQQKVRADQNWQHHFSDVGKLKDLPNDLPTNPKSSRSCTQCHFNYAANYTGPEFTRQSLKHPVALMICANCHGDRVAHVAPQIPFHNEAALSNYMRRNPDFWYSVEARLSDEAKARLTHMPPNLLLNDHQRKEILDYLRTLP